MGKSRGKSRRRRGGRATKAKEEPPVLPEGSEDAEVAKGLVSSAAADREAACSLLLAQLDMLGSSDAAKRASEIATNGLGKAILGRLQDSDVQVQMRAAALVECLVGAGGKDVAGALAEGSGMVAAARGAMHATEMWQRGDVDGASKACSASLGACGSLVVGDSELEFLREGDTGVLPRCGAILVSSAEKGEWNEACEGALGFLWSVVEGGLSAEGGMWKRVGILRDVVLGDDGVVEALGWVCEDKLEEFGASAARAASLLLLARPTTTEVVHLATKTIQTLLTSPLQPLLDEAAAAARHRAERTQAALHKGKKRGEGEGEGEGEGMSGAAGGGGGEAGGEEDGGDDDDDVERAEDDAMNAFASGVSRVFVAAEAVSRWAEVLQENGGEEGGGGGEVEESLVEQVVYFVESGVLGHCVEAMQRLVDVMSSESAKQGDEGWPGSMEAPIRMLARCVIQLSSTAGSLSQVALPLSAPSTIPLPSHTVSLLLRMLQLSLEEAPTLGATTAGLTSTLFAFAAKRRECVEVEGSSVEEWVELDGGVGGAVEVLMETALSKHVEPFAQAHAAATLAQFTQPTAWTSPELATTLSTALGTLVENGTMQVITEALDAFIDLFHDETFDGGAWKETNAAAAVATARDKLEAALHNPAKHGLDEDELERIDDILQNAQPFLDYKESQQ